MRMVLDRSRQNLSEDLKQIAVRMDRQLRLEQVDFSGNVVGFYLGCCWFESRSGTPTILPRVS